MYVGTVNAQIVNVAAQPHLENLRAQLKNGHGIFHKPWAIEFPVIFAMKDVRRGDVFVREIDRRQLAELRAIDEHCAVIFPMGGNDRVHLLITCIFSDEDFANGSCIEPVKTLEGYFEQVQAPTAGDHQCDVTFFRKLHLILI
ncbi:hypothetical protein AEQ67_21675 [Pseudomonas sp. RIT-PI-q]|nr:hypothetical protein AEQ67_21675 [Pseudomonas sp. RIT-PI-q]